MTSPDASYTGPPSILEHDLNQHFPELLKFESTPEMEASDLYKQIRSEVEKILNAVVVESAGFSLYAPQKQAEACTLNALAWNIERGNRFEGIIEALKNHEELNNKDVYLLTELD